MVATDTIVGIVGAVVLVGVMAGVFFYEYNQASADGNGDGTDTRLADFKAAYPALNATEDLDRDDVVNYLDDDIDGDGIANGEDDAMMVNGTIEGTLMGGVGTATSEWVLFFGQGNVHFHADLRYARLPGGVAPDLRFELLAPDGSLVAESRVTPPGPTGGNTVEEIMVEAPQPVGDYTLRVTAPQGSPSTSFTGTWAITYSAV
jgi:hypothetical protein